MKYIIFMIMTGNLLAQEYSLNFDGVNDYAQIPLDDDHLYPGDIATGSMTMWVKFNSVDFGGHVHTGIYSLGNAAFSGTSKALLGIFTLENNNIRFGVLRAGWKWVDSGLSPAADQWYHIATMWGSGGIKIYINGQLQATNSHSGDLKFSYNHFLGAGNQASTTGFDGKIDRLSVWNIQISQTQINALMSESPMDWAGQGNNSLVAYFDFNQNPNPVVDLKNSNDPTVSGAVYSTDVPVDECGTIGGTGPSGCDNVCGSNKINDVCGVCGGDGSTCAESIRYVPFRSKWLLLALMAALGGWLLVRRG